MVPDKFNAEASMPSGCFEGEGECISDEGSKTSADDHGRFKTLGLCCISFAVRATCHKLKLASKYKGEALSPADSVQKHSLSCCRESSLGGREIELAPALEATRSWIFPR